MRIIKAVRRVTPLLLAVVSLCGCSYKMSVEQIALGDAPETESSLECHAALTRIYFHNAAPTIISGTVLKQSFYRFGVRDKSGKEYSYLVLAIDVYLKEVIVEGERVPIATDADGVLHVIQGFKSQSFLDEIAFQPLKLEPGSEALIALHENMERFLPDWSESEKAASDVIGAPEVVYNSVFSAVKQPSGEYSVHRQMNRIMDEHKETYSCDELVSAMLDWRSAIDTDFVPRMD